MGFEGKLSAGSDVSAAMHALAQHNDNASHIAFIGRLREISTVASRPWICARGRVPLIEIQREACRFLAVDSCFSHCVAQPFDEAWHPCSPRT
jgi:hypothetical protein